MFDPKIKPRKCVQPMPDCSTLHLHGLPMHTGGVIRQDQKRTELQPLLKLFHSVVGGGELPLGAVVVSLITLTLPIPSSNEPLLPVLDLVEDPCHRVSGPIRHRDKLARLPSIQHHRVGLHRPTLSTEKFLEGVELGLHLRRRIARDPDLLSGLLRSSSHSIW